MKLRSIRRITIVLILGLITNIQAAELNNKPAQLKVNREMVKNFVKSLIIPGWGQYSNGHKVRAVGYLAAEIGVIYGYQSNFNAAETQEVEFKAFADENWDFQVWYSLTDDEFSHFPVFEAYGRTHKMPTYTDTDGTVQPYRDHHFYENISKYREFVAGWTDRDEMWEEGTGNYTPLKVEYIDMRTRSNELFRNSRTFGTLIMVNHLISAFDAALGSNMTTFETTNYTGNIYINPLNAYNSIALEVKF